MNKPRFNKTKTLILLGDGLSAFGSWIDYLAILTLAAYVFHVNPYDMAVVAAAGLLPGILVSGRIGKLCDRRNPKTVLMVSLALRVLATVAVFYAHNYWLFLFAVAARSFVASASPIAINVLTVRVLEPSSRDSFFANLNVINSIAKICAPVLGAVTSSVANEGLALLLSGTLAAVALIAFSRIDNTPKSADNASVATTRGESSEDSSLVPIIATVSVYFFFVFMVNNLLPLILQSSGYDKSLLGVLVSCAGAGNVVTGLWLSKRSNTQLFKGKIGELAVPAAIQAVGFAALGWVVGTKGLGYTLLPVVFFVTGMASARFSIAMSVFLSKRHAKRIGSASGQVQGAQNLMILLAPIVGAYILDKFGEAVLFWSAGMLALVGMGLILTLVGRVSVRKSRTLFDMNADIFK
jgi:predicted MFS family arabinose efflux permease